MTLSFVQELDEGESSCEGRADLLTDTFALVGWIYLRSSAESKISR